jgi:hypothetical protein
MGGEVRMAGSKTVKISARSHSGMENRALELQRSDFFLASKDCPE